MNLCRTAASSTQQSQEEGERSAGRCSRGESASSAARLLSWCCRTITAKKGAGAVCGAAVLAGSTQQKKKSWIQDYALWKNSWKALLIRDTGYRISRPLVSGRHLDFRCKLRPLAAAWCVRWVAPTGAALGSLQCRLLLCANATLRHVGYLDTYIKSLDFLKKQDTIGVSVLVR